MGIYDEMRSFKREPFDAPITVNVSEKDAVCVITAEKNAVCVDISPRGVGVVADFPLTEGQVLKLCMPSLKDGVALPCYGMVVWKKKLNGKTRAGLVFL